MSVLPVHAVNMSVLAEHAVYCMSLLPLHAVYNISVLAVHAVYHLFIYQFCCMLYIICQIYLFCLLNKRSNFLL